MVALIGNGINRVENNYSWETLIQSLLIEYGDNSIKIRGKPFNLLYEEILSRSLFSKIVDREYLVLESISEHIKKFSFNIYHKKAIEKYNTIITTNYDYAFEQIDLDIDIDDIKSISKELRYSINRKINIKNNKNSIWHIHGEANKPNSICIGYEHYSAYIQQMRNYIIDNRKYFNVDNPPDEYNESWLKYIFTEDIDIIGLDLNFSEIDLWWLIIYRSRSLNRHKKENVNKITYYLKEEEYYSEKDIEKFELLKANNIIIEKVKAKTYKEYYKKVLEK